MTKQKEIDWGLRNLIRELTGEDGTVFLYNGSKTIREYLCSQGAMLKVKCPDCVWWQFEGEVVGMTPCYRCNSTGYIFEPLIEEAK